MNRSGRAGGLQRAADELKEKLGRFAGRPRFNQEFEMAFDFYFGHELGELHPALDEADFERFMEWFIHDYPMSNGHRLIEIFDLEFGAELSAAGRCLLRRWRHAHLTVLEAVEGEGETWRLNDLLTGRVLESVRIPGELPTRWSLIVGRPLPVGDGYELSDAYTLLPPGVKESLIEHLRGEYRRYRRDSGNASVESFLRENGHYFNDLLDEMADEIAAAEGGGGAEGPYRLIHSQAVFEAGDTAGVIARLLAFGDIVQVRPGRLLWQDAEGRTLAQIGFVNGRMQVQCWSRERLEACKKRLSRRLEGLVRHLVDVYRDTAPVVPDGTAGGSGRAGFAGSDSAITGNGASDSAVHGEMGSSPNGSGISFKPDGTGLTDCGPVDTSASEALRRSLGFSPGEEAAALACEEFIRSWLERPHAALGHVSPSRLVSTKLGKARVAELLKQMEHRQRERFGDAGGVAVQELRHRLGLGDEDGRVFPLNGGPGEWNRDTEKDVIDELVRFGGDELTMEHVDSALWMWWNYRSYATTAIRKPTLWAAAVYACLAFVEDWPLTHQEIATRFGVSTASVVKNSWKIVDRLGLRVFDPRYCIFQRIHRDGFSLPGSSAGSKSDSSGGARTGSATGLMTGLEAGPGTGLGTGRVTGPAAGSATAVASLGGSRGRDSVEPGRPIDDGLWQKLAAADRLREQIALVVDAQVVLQQRAHAFYTSHVGSRRAAKWERAFLDWYHFDWRVPVMGGRTLIEVALESGAFSGTEYEMLKAWVDCHPSFYVVKGVERVAEDGTGSGHSRQVRLTLVDLIDSSKIAVDWLRLSNPVVPGDVIFARLLPVDGAMVSLGPVLDFPPRFKEIFHEALIEDWALVERWNGTPLAWDEFRALYAERLYALALQSASDAGWDFYDDDE